MINTKETIFNYDLNDLEREVLAIDSDDEATYIQNSPAIKKLSDLHLLFLMRKDKENRERTIEVIKRLDDLALNNI